MKKPSGPRSDEPDQGLVDIVAIDRLAQIIQRYDLSEVEIDFGEVHVRLARERTAVTDPLSTAAARTPAAVSAPEAFETGVGTPSETETADLAGAVKSPMVGTAYLRPSPEAKPFVEIGAVEKTGDKLMLVEAMKTFNDIVAPRAGKIVEILVAEGSPVEYGQTLMVIE